MDFAAVDRRLAELERTIAKPVRVKADEPLYVGVDLGTAYIVVVVVDSKGRPVACALQFAQVVRDGLVVDYMGASDIVRRLVAELSKKLGRELHTAAIAVPPGTGPRECATHRHVTESADLSVETILDEPTAANAVLGVTNGAVVDIGGGTTGISIFEDGRVVYTADEPTGGTHLSLVLAGSYRVSFEEAEAMKKDPARQKEIFPVVTPVLEKMGSIVRRHIAGRNVEAVYLVGGTCCLPGMEKVVEKEAGCPVFKPANPFLVTPFGIALSCER